MVDFSWLRSGERVVVVVIRRGLFVEVGVCVHGLLDEVDDVRQLK